MASINPKDLEAISAYIDQALDSRAQARLEERLEHEPELRAELNSMRRTRRILRSTPAVRAPRNFTLTPEMVGAVSPAPNRFLSVTRFTFALASIFFVFTLVGNYTFGNVTPVHSEQSTAYAVPAEEQADAAEVMEAPVEPSAERVVEDTAAQDAAAAGETTIVEEAPVEEGMAVEATDTVESMKVPPAGGGGEPPVEPAPETLPSGGSGVTEAAPTEEAMQAMAPPPEESLSVAAEESTGDAAAAADTQVMEAEAASEPAASTENSAVDQPAEKIVAETPAGEAPTPNLWALGAMISGALALVAGGLSIGLRKK